MPAMPARRRKPPVPVWLIVLAGCLAVAVPVAVGVGAVALAVWSAPATYERGEFRKLVMGKKADDVIRAVGRPDQTQDSDRDQYWYYRERTYDRVTGNLDFSAQVVFRDGRVVAVNY